MTPATCPACQAGVLQAQDSHGQPLLLHPTPSRSSTAPVAARWDGGTLLARSLAPGEALAEGEERYVPHGQRCAGRGGAKEAWRVAEVGRAARGRQKRPRARGAHAGGWAAGIRVWPTGWRR